MSKHKNKNKTNARCPKYRGQAWIDPKLPTTCRPWLLGKGYASCKGDRQNQAMLKEVKQSLQQRDWHWPQRELYFLTDMHADTDAFLASLVASGGVVRTGSGDRDFRLTKAGKKAGFLIGGDCFDKGPSTLRLLDAIKHLRHTGANLRILVGNHDVRLLLGIHALGLERDPRTEHFFIRMGPKVIPLLKEVNERYLRGRGALRDIPGKAKVRRLLYPGKRWFDEFPGVADWAMPQATVKREVERIHKKIDAFEGLAEQAGLSLRQIYAAAQQVDRLILRPGGEFYWFYKQLRLVQRSGSLLFIHAGLDDQIAKLVRDKGIKTLNKRFHKQMYHDPFEFYYGPLANTVRTKYRNIDHPWSRRGAQRLHSAGIHALVHGHDNLRCGQRIIVRKGMINIQCDATVDRNSRVKEGFKGPGAAVTIFQPSGRILGISTDSPHVKVFDPRALLTDAGS
jgi:hypothetical protein